MSDLRERLRTLAGLANKEATPISRNYALHLEAAADEIDRLRNIAIERMDLFKQAANNVEHLDAEITDLRKANALLHALVSNRDAEIASLRVSLEQAVEHGAKGWEQAAAEAAMVALARNTAIKECAAIADAEARIPDNTPERQAHIYSASCIAGAIRRLALTSGLKQDVSLLQRD